MSAEHPKSVSRTRVLLLHGLKACLGAAIVAFLLHKYDFGKILANLAGVEAGPLAVAWTYGLLATLSLAYVQSLVFRPLGNTISTLSLLKIQLQLRFYAMFLPGGGPVVVKWYKLARPSGKPGLTAGLMVFARVVSASSVAAVTAVAVYLDHGFPWPSVQRVAPWIALVACVWPLVLLSPPGWRLMGRLKQRVSLPKRVRTLTEKLAEFPPAIRSFRARDLAVILSVAAVSQVCFILQQVYCGRAVGIDLPAITFAWLRAVVAFCANVPVTIAGLGLREASMASFLSYYAVPQEQAIAYALLFFVAFPVLKGVIGGVLELIDFLRSVDTGRKASRE